MPLEQRLVGRRQRMWLVVVPGRKEPARRLQAPLILEPPVKLWH